MDQPAAKTIVVIKTIHEDAMVTVKETVGTVTTMMINPICMGCVRIAKG